MTNWKSIVAATIALSLGLPGAAFQAQAQSTPSNWEECYIACLAAGNRDPNFCAYTCYDRFPDDGGGYVPPAPGTCTPSMPCNRPE